MSPIKKVFLFVSVTVSLYGILSILFIRYHVNFLSFNNINLVSDVVKEKKKTDSVLVASNDSLTEQIPAKDSTAEAAGKSYSFSNFKYADLVTSFETDTTQPSLTHLDAKLSALKQGKKVKIRIAYLGDSMIEGDLLTQTLRKLLQGMFGGYGVGFVPVTSPSANFRNTVTVNFSSNWKDDNFKTASSLQKQTLFFSGHTYYGNNSWVNLVDHTAPDSVILEKSLFCGASNNNTFTYNEQPFTVNTSAKFNKVLLSTDASKTAKLIVNNESVPVYGISFESPSGVLVDNFSFRGISGVELNAIDSSFLKTIDQNNPYDMIILGYGVNVLFEPNEKNFTWYRNLLSPVVKKFKKSFPNSDIVIVSTADRAFRYDGEYKSAVGIDSLIKIQASLAFNNGICFYNQFATMGGKNSIVKWANESPSLANKDYIHPNQRGADILATRFYNAILNDYNKYIAATNTRKTN